MKTINFMGQRRLAIVISTLLLLISIASLSINQLNWGLDFTGGTLVEVYYDDSAPLEEIRGSLSAGGFDGALYLQWPMSRAR